MTTMQIKVGRWFFCDGCRDYYFTNRSAIRHACASVGIERGMTTNESVSLFMRQLHDEHTPASTQ